MSYVAYDGVRRVSQEGLHYHYTIGPWALKPETSGLRLFPHINWHIQQDMEPWLVSVKNT